MVVSFKPVNFNETIERFYLEHNFFVYHPIQGRVSIRQWAYEPSARSWLSYSLLDSLCYHSEEIFQMWESGQGLQVKVWWLDGSCCIMIAEYRPTSVPCREFSKGNVVTDVLEPCINKKSRWLKYYTKFSSRTIHSQTTNKRNILRILVLPIWGIFTSVDKFPLMKYLSIEEFPIRLRTTKTQQRGYMWGRKYSSMSLHNRPINWICRKGKYFIGYLAPDTWKIDCV